MKNVRRMRVREWNDRNVDHNGHCQCDHLLFYEYYCFVCVYVVYSSIAIGGDCYVWIELFFSFFFCSQRIAKKCNLNRITQETWRFTIRNGMAISWLRATDSFSLLICHIVVLTLVNAFLLPLPSLSLSTLSVPFYLSGTISFSSSLASSRCPSISFRLELSFSCTLSPLSLLPLCPFSRLDSLNLISWVGLITAIQQIQIVKYSKTRSLSLPQKSRANDLNIGI